LAALKSGPGGEILTLSGTNGGTNGGPNGGPNGGTVNDNIGDEKERLEIEPYRLIAE
jgi:hypothetical protein